MESKEENYIIADFNTTYELVFFADFSFPRPKPYLLIKNKNKYSVFNDYQDLSRLKTMRTYSLNQSIKLLSGGREHLFDQSICSQYVLEDLKK